MGEALKNQSDRIMDATFSRDIAYRKCYIDGEEVEAKFFVKSSYTISKDQIEYLVQFRPGYRPEDYTNGRLGMFIEIPDERNNYNTWMIVGVDDQPQFVKYYVLRTNWTIKWIHDGVIYSQLGVLRSRNSYSSGIWTDYLTTTPEAQNMIWLPTNEKVQTIKYNQRFLISDNQVNPMAWQVTGPSDTFPLGVTKLVFKQDLFNPATDNRELMIADYYKSNIEPTDTKEEKSFEIKCKGSNVLKVGGNKKTFRCYLDDEQITDKVIQWEISGIENTLYNKEETQSSLSILLEKNYSLIGKVVTVTAKIPDENLSASLLLEVTGL